MHALPAQAGIDRPRLADIPFVLRIGGQAAQRGLVALVLVLAYAAGVEQVALVAPVVTVGVADLPACGQGVLAADRCRIFAGAADAPFAHAAEDIVLHRAAG
jgi:hypothetical protein